MRWEVQLTRGLCVWQFIHGLRVRRCAAHPITGKPLDEASAIALRATGGGTVSETEVGDEETYYQVEITKADGSQVDVQLDRGFNLVGQSADREPQDPGR